MSVPHFPFESSAKPNAQAQRILRNQNHQVCDEHGVPHFHAHHAGEAVVVGIQPLTVLAGGIRARQFGMVMEWAAKHQSDLLHAWHMLQAGGEPEKIAALE